MSAQDKICSDILMAKLEMYCYNYVLTWTFVGSNWVNTYCFENARR